MDICAAIFRQGPRSAAVHALVSGWALLGAQGIFRWVGGIMLLRTEKHREWRPAIVDQRCLSPIAVPSGPVPPARAVSRMTLWTA
jgi:hypothetical protein